MINEVSETAQLDVKPPEPRIRKVLIGMSAVLLLVAVVGAAVAATANHTIPRQVDPTTGVMPVNTILYLSLNLHTEKLPNFNVIAEAWKDSKEARQIASALELGFMQAGLNWEEDLQPWLGERAAVALIDWGGRDYSVEQSFDYRTPFYMIVAQTKDRAKSDTVLADILKQLSKRSKGTIETETYRDIVVTYINSLNKYLPENSAFATIDDLVVLTPSRDYLKTAINAALDGQNLSASENYKTVMTTLPDQNAGVFYVDFSLYVNEAIREAAATARTIEASKNKTYDLYTSIYSNTHTTPDPGFLE